MSAHLERCREDRFNWIDGGHHRLDRYRVCTFSDGSFYSPMIGFVLTVLAVSAWWERTSSYELGNSVDQALRVRMIR